MKKSNKKETPHSQRSRKFGGLFRTIFLTAILCMTIPLCIIAVTTCRSVYSSMRNTSNENLQQLSKEKMNQVNSIIQNQIALTKAVADSPYVSAIVAEQYQSGKLNEEENIKLQDYLGTIFAEANGLYENFSLPAALPELPMVWEALPCMMLPVNPGMTPA